MYSDRKLSLLMKMLTLTLAAYLPSRLTVLFIITRKKLTVPDFLRWHIFSDVLQTLFEKYFVQQ